MVCAVQRVGQRVMASWVGAFALIALCALSGCASETPTLFTPERPIAASAFTHDAWDRVLQAHVRGERIDYAGIAQDPDFASYIDSLNRVDPLQFATREARLAFWINAYNAFAMRGLLGGYAPTSLWGRQRFFVGHDHHVGGAPISLYSMERNLLIPTYQEARMHFALFTGAASGPKIQPWAYRAESLAEQLDHATREFVNDPERNRFDTEARVAYLSQVFNWFAPEFIRQGGSVVQFLRPYVEDAGVATALKQTPHRIEYLPFDWSVPNRPRLK
ncbi:MAG: DUF547 domain-containing protein [Nitrospiraceae bacterium]